MAVLGEELELRLLFLTRRAEHRLRLARAGWEVRDVAIVEPVDADELVAPHTVESDCCLHAETAFGRS